jgi:hypothetical protein
MIRSVIIDPNDMRRAMAIARREGITPTAVLRGLIVQSLAAYEREHGPIAIEGVPIRSWATRPPHERPASPQSASA